MNNAHVLVRGHHLRLVPYLPQHVPRYHQWMGDSELLQFTESEPLTLAEEYANQQEWLCAADKLTFILLAPLSVAIDESSHTTAHVHALPDVEDDNSLPDAREAEDGRRDGSSESENRGHTEDAHMNTSITERNGEGKYPSGNVLLNEPQICTPVMATPSGTAPTPHTPLRREEHQSCCPYVMIGDCNLFCIDPDDVNGTLPPPAAAVAAARVDCSGDARDESHRYSDGDDERWFEISVMVAEPLFRRRGMGEEAARLLLSYALDKLGATTFVAKILSTNNSSIQFFTKKLGFTKLKEVPVFNEVHYYKRFVNNTEKEAWWAEAGYKLDVYDEVVEQSMTVLYSFPGSSFAFSERGDS